jgi:hypothetical protein
VVVERGADDHPQATIAQLNHRGLRGSILPAHGQVALVGLMRRRFEQVGSLPGFAIVV